MIANVKEIKKKQKQPYKTEAATKNFFLHYSSSVTMLISFKNITKHLEQII